MAKIAKKSATKASLIRTILTAEPQTPTKEVVDALATKGVKVSANHVYLIKSKMKMKKRRQKREKAAAVIQRTGCAEPGPSRHESKDAGPGTRRPQDFEAARGRAVGIKCPQLATGSSKRQVKLGAG